MQGGARRLAEIIVGFALGLDLSTLAAIASGQFATAHEKLGRNRPTHGLKDEHLDRKFFAMVLGSRGRFVDWSRWNVSDQVKGRGAMAAGNGVAGGLLVKSLDCGSKGPGFQSR